MILGSHNTMTYKKPKQWWFRLLPCMFRCQRKDYRKQHELGAMVFDLRLFWKDGVLEYRHGLLRFDASDIDEILQYASDNNIVVRLILETRSYNVNKIKDIDTIRNLFITFCDDMEQKYPDILFCCGQENATKQTLYHFKNSSPRIDELHASVTSLFKCDWKWLRYIDDIYPIIYARRKNKKNIQAYKEDESKENVYLLVDYVDIQ